MDVSRIFENSLCPRIRCETILDIVTVVAIMIRITEQPEAFFWHTFLGILWHYHKALPSASPLHECFFSVVERQYGRDHQVKEGYFLKPDCLYPVFRCGLCPCSASVIGLSHYLLKLSHEVTVTVVNLSLVYGK